MSKEYLLTTRRPQHKNILSSWFFVFLFSFSLFFSVVWFSRSVDTATPPSIITYQGKLLENGASVTTTKAFSFTIYDADSGGTALYTASGTLPTVSTISITPTQGIFSVDLGGDNTNTIDPTIFSDNDTLYLEVIVDGTTLTPRKRVTASPYAINSTYLNGVAATSTPQSVTYIPLSDIDGSFVFNTTTFNNAITVSSTATSTFLGGIDLATGNCFSVNGACISGGSSQWTTSGSDIYFSSGNVGIGTSTPQNPLTVVGHAYFADMIEVAGVGTSTFAGSIDLASGNCFAVNGVCITGGSGSSKWTQDSGLIYPTLSSTDAVIVASTTLLSNSLEPVLDGMLFSGFFATAFGTQKLAVHGALQVEDGVSVLNNTIQALDFNGISTLLVGDSYILGPSGAGSSLFMGINASSTAAQGIRMGNMSQDIFSVMYDEGDLSVSMAGDGSDRASLLLDGFLNVTGSVTSTFAGSIAAQGIYMGNMGQSNFSAEYDAGDLRVRMVGDGPDRASLLLDGFLNVIGSVTSTFAGSINLASGNCFAVDGVCITGGSGSSKWTQGVGFLFPSTSTNAVVIGASVTSTDDIFQVYGDIWINGITAGRGGGDISSNTGFGASALSSNTTGIQNNAFGNLALFSNTTGTLNNAFGSYALNSNTIGAFNSAFGSYALSSNTTGTLNNAFGLYALRSNTTGGFNSAFGSSALFSNTTGIENSAFGSSALYSNTTGTLNSAFGSSALRSNTTGIENSAFGSSALFSNTAGTLNSAFGSYALNSNTAGTLNSAFGSSALRSNTTGIENSAFGSSALFSNTTGIENSAFGSSALNSNTIGAFNNAFGSYALDSNTTGAFNNAFGSYALDSNTTGDSNSAFGSYALRSNTTGTLNSAFGSYALRSNTTGGFNSAFGSSALFSNTTGIENSAFGSYALNANTTGSNNNALGRRALAFNTTGTSNNAFGHLALYSNISGSSNSAFGDQALGSNVTGQSNIALGALSLFTNIFGSFNVAIGQNTGGGIVSGSYNTILGSQVTGLPSALSNNIIIADGEGNQRIRVLDNGYVGINTTTPGYPFTVEGNSYFSGMLDVGGTSTSTFAGSIDLASGNCFAVNGVCITGGSGSSKWTQDSGLIYPTLSSTDAVIVASTTLLSNSLEPVLDMLSPGFFAAAFGTQKLAVHGALQVKDGVSVLDNTIQALDFSGISTLLVGDSYILGPSGAGSSLYMGINASSTAAQGIYMGTMSQSNFSVVYDEGDLSVSMVGDGTDRASLLLDGILDVVGGSINLSSSNCFMIDGSCIASFTDGGGYMYPTITSDSLVLGGIATSSDALFQVYGDIWINGITAGRGGNDIASNTAFGGNALVVNNLGYYNNAFGYNSLASNVDGIANNAFGYNALASNIDGQSNNAFGLSALYTSTSSIANNAFGSSVLFSNTTGISNNAFGHLALYSNTSGSSNSAFGDQALGSNVTGQSNIALGALSLSTNTSGSFNVAIGQNTGGGIVTGSYNTILGSQVTGLPSALSNNIIIADGEGNQRIRVLDSGYVGIGTTTPSYLLHVVTSTDGIVAAFTDSEATCIVDPSDGDFSCTSDRDLKTNITVMGTALDSVMRLSPVVYNWNTDPNGEANYGFIAQEVEAIFPRLVGTGANGYKTLSQIGLIPFLTKAIQEQQLQINTLSSALLQGSGVDLTSGSFEGTLRVAKHVSFGEDTVGQVKLLAGATSVRVTFTEYYEHQPIVTVSPLAFISGQYRVTEENEEGFTLELSESQPSDVVFNWHAFAGEGAKLTVSDGSFSDITLVVVDQGEESSGGGGEGEVIEDTDIPDEGGGEGEVADPEVEEVPSGEEDVPEDVVLGPPVEEIAPESPEVGESEPVETPPEPVEEGGSGEGASL